MYFLILIFSLAVFVLLFIYFSKKNTATDTVPYLPPMAVPTVRGPTEAPVLVNPSVQKGLDLVTDLKKITADVEKITDEDQRLIPPVFTLEKEVTQ